MRLIALDLLRFAAATAVMLYHFFQNADTSVLPGLQSVFAYGYLGVPGFFIISGYVISLSAANSSASGFAISRFVRLFPTYWLAILFTVVVCAIFGGEQFTFPQVITNLTMMNEAMGYENVDDVYWTLHEELKFYACIFLLVFFGVFHHYKIWLSTWLLLTVSHLALGQDKLNLFAAIISPYYSSFFITGIAFYLIQQAGLTLYNTAILGVSSTLSAYHLYHLAVGFMPEMGITSQVVSVLCLLTVLILFYLLVTDKIALQRRKIYLTLGALTYPLYLIHSVAGDAIVQSMLDYMSHGTAIIACSVFMLIVSYLITTQFEGRVCKPLKSKLMALFSVPSSTPAPTATR